MSMAGMLMRVVGKCVTEEWRSEMMRCVMNRVVLTVGLAVCLLMGVVRTTQAIVIDFETGYVAGDLTNQPSAGTQWTLDTSDPSSFQVLELYGGKVLRAQDTDFTLNERYSFNASDADLGGTFDSDASVLDFGFKFLLGSTGGGNVADVARFYVGDSGANSSVYLFLRSDGRISYYHGATTKWVIDQNGGYFYATPGTWYSLSGQLDYGANEWTLSVDNLVQTDQEASPSTRLDFYNSAASIPKIVLMSNNADESYFRTVTYDVIELGMAAATSSSGKLADFEAASGYTVRDLDQQPGAGAVSWLVPHSAGGLMVMDDAGNRLITTKPHASTDISFYKLASAQDQRLSSFLPDESALTFNYRMRWDTVNASETVLSRVYLGSTSSYAFFIFSYSDGRLAIYNGATTFVQDSGGSDFYATAGQWYDISVKLAYGASDTYTVTVNGVLQGSDLAFKNADASPDITLGVFARTSASFEETDFDDFDISLPRGTVVVFR